MLAIELPKLEDFISQVKKHSVDEVFLDFSTQEGKIEPDKRVLIESVRLVGIKADMSRTFITSLVLAQKEITKKEDEAEFAAAAKAKHEELCGILRNLAPGVIQTDGAVWPVK